MSNENPEILVIILNFNTWRETLEEVKLCNQVLKINYQDHCQE